jgi:hypothetical protein
VVIIAGMQMCNFSRLCSPQSQYSFKLKQLHMPSWTGDKSPLRVDRIDA